MKLRVGNTLRCYVESHFSRDACVSNYEALFQKAINQYQLTSLAGVK